MMKRTAPDFQAEDRTARELDLEQRLRAGDHQIMDDLLALLQPYLLRRASQYIIEYRHVLPVYIEALDLVQEASLVIWKCIEEARTKEAPLGYLIAAGCRTMWYLCCALMKEPPASSLDEPCFPDDDTPSREYLPTSIRPASPYAQEAPGAYESLYQAISQLPESEQVVIEQAYGIGEQAAQGNRDIGRGLGWSGEYVSYQKQKALATLGLALQEVRVLSEQSAQTDMIPEEYRQRLDQAYADIQAKGRPVSWYALLQKTGIEAWIVKAYLRIHEKNVRLLRRERVRQKLDRAYAALQARQQPITPEALRREARAGWKAVRAYLSEREALLSSSLTFGFLSADTSKRSEMEAGHV